METIAECARDHDLSPAAGVMASLAVSAILWVVLALALHFIL